jgi:MoxR-like ATPase
MQRGAVLLLDEIDRGTNKIMCVQPVLEGKAIFVKKINQVIQPEAGFTIIATANTKGKGNTDGRFIGTRVMNEAFLDRFASTFEQDYPPEEQEMKILVNALKKHNLEDDDFVQRLVTWGGVTRRSFQQQVVDEIISTRRLVMICDNYAIFRNKQQVLELCLNRFEDQTKRDFFEMYTKLDPSVTMAS